MSATVCPLLLAITRQRQLARGIYTSEHLWAQDPLPHVFAEVGLSETAPPLGSA